MSKRALLDRGTNKLYACRGKEGKSKSVGISRLQSADSHDDAKPGQGARKH